MERFLGNRKDKDEEGSVIILVAVLMVVFLGMAALVVDLGADYVYKAKMQTACDTASRAAASALPDTTKATELAKYYMKGNGFTDTRNVQVEFQDSNSKVQVYLKEERKTTFARALGIKSNKISTVAVATKGGSSSPRGFKYAIFSGDKDATLKLGAVYKVDGAVHANGKIWSSPGSGYAFSFEASKGFEELNSSTTKIGVKNGDNVNLLDVTSDEAKSHINSNARYEEMPTYLGENIEKLIVKPSVPENFDLTIAEVNKKGSEGYKSIKYIGNETWWGGTWSFGNDLLIDNSSRSGDYNLGGGKLIINGDLYINGNTNKNTTLSFYSGGIEINGNVYCAGKLKLAGSKVHIKGNVYCVGDLYLESGDVKFDSTYIYANSFTATNGFVLSGALVTEKDINITGAMAQINSSSDSTMTMYSKYGNINGGQASSEYHGLVFAPNGDISWCGNSINIYGSIIGKTINGIPANVTIHPLDRDLEYDTNNPNGSATGSGIMLIK